MTTPLETQPVHPACAGTSPLTAEGLWRIPRVGPASPLPDGSAAVVSVTTFDLDENRGRSRLWLVSLDSAGPDPRPLTAVAESSSLPRVSPDGRSVAFLRTEGEKRRKQPFVLPLDGGEAERVAELPLGAVDLQWMPSSDALVVAGVLLKGHLDVAATLAERDRRAEDPVKAHVSEETVVRYWDRWLTGGRVPHLFLLDLASSELRDLTPKNEATFLWMDPTGCFDVAPDGSELCFAAAAFSNEDNRYRNVVTRVEIESGRSYRIAPTDAEGAHGPRYAPDGRTIIYGVKFDPAFYADRMRLRRHDLESGEDLPVLMDWHRSPATWEIAPDGAIWLLAQDDARTSVFRMESFETEPTLVARGGTFTGLAIVDAARVIAGRSDLSHPAELHVVAAASGARTVTDFTASALEGVSFGEVRETVIEGAEGAPVQMFIVYPPGGTPDEPLHSEPLPLVQVIHGGPHGISADSFHPRWNAQLFAAPGYVAALVNFQGSTSWGQDFAERIQGHWGDRPYGDVMAATDVLVAAGIADETRMAAAGGSYGGYLVSWISTQTDRFRCVINHAGVFDTQGMFASDMIHSRRVSFGGLPWDAEGLDRWNPVRHAGSIVTPTLVIHGELDYRVPFTQGLLAYSLLKDQGVPARLVHFPDENHWVLKPHNSLLWYREVHAWLERYLVHGVEGE